MHSRQAAPEQSNSSGPTNASGPGPAVQTRDSEGASSRSNTESFATTHEAASARENGQHSRSVQHSQQGQPASGQASQPRSAPDFAATEDRDAAPDRHNLAESTSAALTAKQEATHQQDNARNDQPQGSRNGGRSASDAQSTAGYAHADASNGPHPNADSVDEARHSREGGGEAKVDAKARSPVKFGRPLPGMTPFANGRSTTGITNAPERNLGERRPSLASRQLPSVLAAQARQRAHEEGSSQPALSPHVQNGQSAAESRQSGPHAAHDSGNDADLRGKDSSAQQLAARPSRDAERREQAVIKIPAGAPLPSLSLAGAKGSANVRPLEEHNVNSSDSSLQAGRPGQSSTLSTSATNALPQAGNASFHERSAQLDDAEVSGFPSSSLSRAGGSPPAAQQAPLAKIGLVPPRPEPSLVSNLTASKQGGDVSSSGESSATIKARHADETASKSPTETPTQPHSRPPMNPDQAPPSSDQSLVPSPTPFGSRGVQVPSDTAPASSQSAQLPTQSPEPPGGVRTGSGDILRPPRIPISSPGSQFSEAQQALRSGSTDGTPPQHRAPPSRNVILAKAASIDGGGLKLANGDVLQAPRRQISKINIAAIFNAPAGSPAGQVISFPRYSLECSTWISGSLFVEGLAMTAFRRSFHSEEVV